MIRSMLHKSWERSGPQTAQLQPIIPHENVYTVKHSNNKAAFPVQRRKFGKNQKTSVWNLSCAVRQPVQVWSNMKDVLCRIAVQILSQWCRKVANTVAHVMCQVTTPLTVHGDNFSKSYAGAVLRG